MSGSRIKNRIWEVLEPPATGDRLSQYFDLFMVAFILVSVAGVALRTVSSVMESYRWVIFAIEVCSVVIFTVEVLLRLWVADLGTARGEARGRRILYLKSVEGVVDLVAVVPVYIAFVSPASWNPVLAGILLLRILKLVRYSPALATLVAVIVNERKVLLGALTIMMVALLFSSTIIYLVERDNQPEEFGSIPAAMWWGLATLTTVGYGDVTPITPLGKLFGAAVMILGVGMFALPAGILSSGFAQELKQQRLLRIMDLVSGVPLFKTLDAHDVARVSRLLDPLIVQAGQVVVRQGDDAASMFFVAGGELEVDVDGHRERLRTEFFGEIALLEGGTRSATIRTLSRCQLLVLEQDHFEELLESSPRIDRAVRAIAKRRLQADERRGEVESDPEATA